MVKIFHALGMTKSSTTIYIDSQWKNFTKRLFSNDKYNNFLLSQIFIAIAGVEFIS